LAPKDLREMTVFGPFFNRLRAIASARAPASSAAADSDDADSAAGLVAQPRLCTGGAWAARLRVGKKRHVR
jgi:hypothetical protein